MELPHDALARPPEEVARRMALVRLEDALAAGVQLSAGGNESLHDFRVAVRRLRAS
jgi:CHAD domain-containing protein